jgi:hypothetical protein
MTIKIRISKELVLLKFRFLPFVRRPFNFVGLIEPTFEKNIKLETLTFKPLLMVSIAEIIKKNNLQLPVT